jgi:hypothetical protein
LFDRALAELGVPIPTRRDAVKQLARATAADVVDERVSPYEGAKYIWKLTLLLADGHMPELDPFIYAASEWEDRPADRSAFDSAIVQEAKELIDA